MLDDKVACATCSSPDVIESREQSARETAEKRERQQTERAAAAELERRRVMAEGQQAAKRDEERAETLAWVQSLPELTLQELGAFIRSGDEVTTHVGVATWRDKRFPEMNLKDAVQLLSGSGYPTRKIKTIDGGRFAHRKGWIVNTVAFEQWVIDSYVPKVAWVVLLDSGAVMAASTYKGELSEWWPQELKFKTLWDSSPDALKRVHRYQTLKSLPEPGAIF